MKDLKVIYSYFEMQVVVCFKVLYDCYVGRIYVKCILMLKDDVLVQDVIQEIFIKVFFNLLRFKEQLRFFIWVYFIIYNYCIDYLCCKKK